MVYKRLWVFVAAAVLCAIGTLSIIGYIARGIHSVKQNKFDSVSSIFEGRHELIRHDSHGHIDDGGLYIYTGYTDTYPSEIRYFIMVNVRGGFTPAAVKDDVISMVVDEEANPPYITFRWSEDAKNGFGSCEPSRKDVHWLVENCVTQISVVAPSSVWSGLAKQNKQ